MTNKKALSLDAKIGLGIAGTTNIGAPVLLAGFNAALESTHYNASAASIIEAGKDAAVTTGKVVLAIDVGVAAAFAGAALAIKVGKIINNSQQFQKGLATLKNNFK